MGAFPKATKRKLQDQTLAKHKGIGNEGNSKKLWEDWIVWCFIVLYFLSNQTFRSRHLPYRENTCQKTLCSQLFLSSVICFCVHLSERDGWSLLLNGSIWWMVFKDRLCLCSDLLCPDVSSLPDGCTILWMNLPRCPRAQILLGSLCCFNPCIGAQSLS